MGSNSKRVGTFKDFLEGQKRLAENRVSISCDFWDQAIVEVLQEIEIECNGYLVWETIIKYCRDKWAILGRPLPQPDYEDNLLTQHIKDLIFQFHGNSFYIDWKCDSGWDNQQIHSKGIVIEELAATILEKVREKANIQDEVTTEVTGTLSDKEDVTLVPMKAAPYADCEDEYYEDLPFESKRPVKYFDQYIKLLEEAKTQFKLENEQKVIDYTLDRLEQEAGSLKLYDIAQVAVRKYGPCPDDEGYVIFNKYVKNIVVEYLYDKGLVQVLVKKNKELCISRNVMDGIFNLFAEMVVADIQHMLVEKSKEEGEDEEAE